MEQKAANMQNFMLAFFSASIVLLIFYLLNLDIFFPIGKNIIDGSGDGLKNLYTFSYYLKYGNSFHFNGMLYPFGDAVTYMDAQPLYVWLIWLVEIIFKIRIENPIIYIHLILLANLFVGAFFIFLLLRYFGVRIFIALMGTVIIILLSPQMYRMGDHFALASMGVIPFFWWWRLQIKNASLHYLSYALVLSLVGFVHPYLLFMVVLLLLTYELLCIVFYRRNKFWILFPLLSFVIFYSSILGLDNSKVRPEIAWGAKNFSCKLYDLFLPLTGSIKDYFLQKYHVEPYYTEGHAYITIFGIFIFITTIYLVTKSIYTKKYFIIKENAIELWLIAAIPILLFAFYIPFRWNEELFAPINPFKQFRGTGRFIFVFYYVYLIYVFVYIDKFYAKKNTLLKILFGIMFLITINDIYNSSKYLKLRYKSFGNQDAYKQHQKYVAQLFNKIKDIKEFESIIVYPPSTEGTEKLWIDNDWNTKITSFWSSLFLGLPMANIHSSRVDFNDCMEIYQLSGFYNIPKPIIEKFNPQKKQFVLLKIDRLNDDIPLVKNAQLIDSLDGIGLMEINLNLLEKNKINQRYWIDSSYTLVGQNLFEQGNDTCLLVNKNTNVLDLDFSKNNFQKIRVLFWYTPNYFKNSSIPICSLFEIDEQGNEIFIKDWRESHTNTYNYRNGWLCIDYQLDISNISKKILFKLDAKQIFIDDFMVYAK